MIRKQETKNMDKKLLVVFLSLGLALFAKAETTDITTLENVVYAEALSGTAASSLTMSIKMKNAVPITGFQFDLELPEGVSVAKDEDDFSLIALSGARTTSKKTNYFDSAPQTDGSIRVMASSTRNYTFDGNDGEVVTVELNIAGTIVDGEYPIVIKNIVLSDVTSKTYETDKVEVALTIQSVATPEYEQGDVDGDGIVDVKDVVALINIILGKNSDIYNTADVNKDKVVNYEDVNVLVEMVRSKSYK